MHSSSKIVESFFNSSPKMSFDEAFTHFNAASNIVISPDAFKYIYDKWHDEKIWKDLYSFVESLDVIHFDRESLRNAYDDYCKTTMYTTDRSKFNSNFKRKVAMCRRNALLATLVN